MAKEGILCSITQSFLDLEKKIIQINPQTLAIMIGVF